MKYLLISVTLSMLQWTNGMMHDSKGRIQMGVSNHGCDDAEWKIETDINCDDFICPLTSPDIKGALIPRVIRSCPQTNYGARHACMNERIVYNRTIPSSGTHRPLWPKYGEYAYVPPQRWIHSLEHGAVVFLYHPCLEMTEVNLLRQAVQIADIKKFILTPYNLPERMPIAIVAWRCVMQMNGVDLEQAVAFAKERYDKGPEGTDMNGSYTLGFEETLEKYFKHIYVAACYSK